MALIPILLADEPTYRASVYYVSENTGIPAAELVRSKEGTAYVNENTGLDYPSDFADLQVEQHPVGWGVTPTPRRSVNLPKSRTGTAYVNDDTTV